MSDSQLELKNHEATKDFLICIDSDGCAFDSMEIKHKECFTPNHIKHWNLQAVSKFAREASEFVNLYSKWRGINRFPATLMMFDLLAERAEVQERGVKMPDVPNLRRWIETETRLGNPALETYCKEHDEVDMHQALEWSKAINATVEDMVHGVPPFPYVRNSLAKAQSSADMLVCSATPHDALVREWKEHEIAEFVFAIAGQEQGSKTEHIRLVSEGRYEKDKIIMIGDAPGDMKAAKNNDVLFYPINPGEEAASWRRFHDEALDKFFKQEYAGEYEANVIREFESFLPDTPPWKHSK